MQQPAKPAKLDWIKIADTVPLSIGIHQQSGNHAWKMSTNDDVDLIIYDEKENRAVLSLSKDGTLTVFIGAKLFTIQKRAGDTNGYRSVEIKRVKVETVEQPKEPK